MIVHVEKTKVSEDEATDTEMVDMCHIVKIVFYVE